MKIYNILKIFLEIAKNVWVIRVYLGILFVCGIIYFYEQKETLAMLSKIAHFEILYLILILNFVAFICYAYVHYFTYRALNAKVSYWQVFQVAAFSRLGVYVPGKIWYATNYYIFSRSLSIGSDKIGRNFIINNAMLFFTGALCSLFAITQLPFLAQYFLIILPFLMLVLIHPKILDKIFSVLMDKLSQFSSENKSTNSLDTDNKSLNYSSYLKFMGLYFGLWFISGAILFLCIFVFELVSIKDFPVIVSAAASSLIIGMLAVFAPGGLGVKEGVGVVMLSPIITLDTAILACILLRLTQVITDFVVGGVAAAFMRKRRSVEITEAGNVRS